MIQTSEAKRENSKSSVLRVGSYFSAEKAQSNADHHVFL